MVLLKERKNEHEPALRFIRIGGYIVLLGIFVGATLGIYALFNPPVFSVFFNIGQHESTLFFLGVYLPSFIIIVGAGYVFATTSKFGTFNQRRTSIICMLVLLSLGLSGVSSFNFLALLGGFLTLIVAVFVYTKPTFRALWKREACFFAQVGTMLTASASVLFFLMWLISNLLQTYSASMRELGFSYPFLLLAAGAFSLLVFFLAPPLCLYGENAGVCGILSLSVSVLSLVGTVRNLDVYLNLSAYQGIFLAFAGTVLMFWGSFVSFRIWRKFAASPVFQSSLLYKGRFCPCCGTPWTETRRNTCPNCHKSLYWKLRGPFCPHCGHLVSQNSRNCPHCNENIETLPFHISLTEMQREYGKLQKPSETLGKLPNRVRLLFSRIAKRKEFVKLRKPFEPVTNWVSHSELYSFRNFVYICILTLLFALFAVFLSSPTVEISPGPNQIRFYGFPLRWLKVTYPLSHLTTIMWDSLILDIILYFLAAAVLLYIDAKISAYMRSKS